LISKEADDKWVQNQLGLSYSAHIHARLSDFGIIRDAARRRRQD
jgi:hypothetical protein